MLISTNMFFYDKARKHFSQEASSLDLKNVPKQIDLKSHKTGTVVKFKCTNIDRSSEGEIEGWIFTSVDDAAKGSSIVIFND